MLPLGKEAAAASPYLLPLCVDHELVVKSVDSDKAACPAKQNHSLLAMAMYMCCPTLSIPASQLAAKSSRRLRKGLPCLTHLIT